MQQLAIFRSPWLLGGHWRSQYGNPLTSLEIRPHRLPLYPMKPRKGLWPRRAQSPSARKSPTKSTSLFETLAGEQTFSEWTCQVLLKAANPSAAEQTILAELLALRMILLNALFTIAKQEP